MCRIRVVTNAPLVIDTNSDSNTGNGNASIYDEYVEVAFLAIVSMQRSSSTSLLHRTLLPPELAMCGISMNEIFLKYPKQSGDAWAIDGNQMNMNQTVKNIDAAVLRDFLLRVARRRCLKKLNILSKNYTVKYGNNPCRRRCVVGYKEFDDHLTMNQHKYLWANLPNF